MKSPQMREGLKWAGKAGARGSWPSGAVGEGGAGNWAAAVVQSALSYLWRG